MFCSKCGRKTDATGKYCQWCGADMTVSPVRPSVRRHLPYIRTDEFAGIGRRTLAFFIDLVFILIIELLVTGIFGLSEGLRMLYQLVRGYPVVDRFGEEVTGTLVPLPVILSVTILIVVVPWLYYALLERSKDQATLGKMAVRIAVTDMNGSRVSFARASLRHFAKIFTLLTIFIGFFIIPFTSRRQALHDIIAGCLFFRQ